MAEGARVNAASVRGTWQRGFSRDFGLRDQMRRSSVSIMANIAEGFERARQSEFHQFLSIAKSSCAELRSHLYVAHDAKYVDNMTFDDLMGIAQEVSLVLGGLRSAVQRRRAEQKPHGS